VASEARQWEVDCVHGEGELILIQQDAYARIHSRWLWQCGNCDEAFTMSYDALMKQRGIVCPYCQIRRYAHLNEIECPPIHLNRKKEEKENE